ncbi:hypothetical protein [Glycomyces xiaoerkulensis]|uniref:hypothetical protein n=1 Tax=Glycomyces xiaoerkulensis TaxID=2038139 RepID=UPI000C268A05|nr:hypothetical protein [Glycomyces xiaoerkulensis]
MDPGRRFQGAWKLDTEPRAAYRDADGRAFAGERPDLIRFEPAVSFRAGESQSVQPPPGHGLLDVLVCTDPACGGTGVLLLDGEVVGAGDGRYQVAVEPGPHRLEVQGADASSTEFTSRTGERVCFTSGHGVSVRHLTGFHTRLYRVTEGSDFLPQINREAARSASVGCLVTIVSLVALLVAAVWAALTGSQVADFAAGTAVLLSAVGLMTGVAMGVRTTHRLHREAESARIAVRRERDPASCLAAAAVGFPSPNDLRRWGRSVSGAALVFDLMLFRVIRGPDGEVAYTGDASELALSHAGRLRTRIDGVEVPCDWATWHYPLDEGPHRFAIEYGPDGLGGTARHEFTLDVRGLSIVYVPVRVFRIWDPVRRELTGREPEITHSLTADGVADVTRLDWMPTRLWPGRPAL